MRKLAGILMGLVILATVAVPVASADTYVNGYYRSNGTYVPGYFRSSPDSTPYNNFSYRGNTNPYTGSTGTKSYDPQYPSYQRSNPYLSYPTYPTTQNLYGIYAEPYRPYERSYDPYRPLNSYGTIMVAKPSRYLRDW